jgi:PAT family beta-lactamase induction signal transducer AmpG
MNKRNPWAWVPTLYFAEGVPYVAVMTISLIMYKRLGLSNTDITLYTSWLYLPWVIKPLWSPFVDMLRTKRWWIITMQLLIGAALAGVAFTIPGPWWLQGSLCFFWLMAFSSATHDIAADGFYMLGLDQHEQAYFVGIRSTFYRIATIFSSGLLVGLAGALQVITRNIRYSWSLVFYLMAGLFIALWLYHSWALPRPSEDGEKMQKTVSGILNEFRQTLVTFFQKPQVWAGICLRSRWIISSWSTRPTDWRAAT